MSQDQEESIPINAPLQEQQMLMEQQMYYQQFQQQQLQFQQLQPDFQGRIQQQQYLPPQAPFQMIDLPPQYPGFPFIQPQIYEDDRYLQGNNYAGQRNQHRNFHSGGGYQQGQQFGHNNYRGMQNKGYKEPYQRNQFGERNTSSGEQNGYVDRNYGNHQGERYAYGDRNNQYNYGERIQNNYNMNNNFRMPIQKKKYEEGQVLVDENLFDDTLREACMKGKQDFILQIEAELEDFILKSEDLQKIILDLDQFDRKILHKICERYGLKRPVRKYSLQMVQKLENNKGNVHIEKTNLTKIPFKKVLDLFDESGSEGNQALAQQKQYSNKSTNIISKNQPRTLEEQEKANQEALEGLQIKDDPDYLLQQQQLLKKEQYKQKKEEIFRSDESLQAEGVKGTTDTEDQKIANIKVGDDANNNQWNNRDKKGIKSTKNNFDILPARNNYNYHNQQQFNNQQGQQLNQGESDFQYNNNSNRQQYQNNIPKQQQAFQPDLSEGLQQQQFINLLNPKLSEQMGQFQNMNQNFLDNNSFPFEQLALPLSLEQQSQITTPSGQQGQIPQIIPALQGGVQQPAQGQNQFHQQGKQNYNNNHNNNNNNNNNKRYPNNNNNSYNNKNNNYQQNTNNFHNNNSNGNTQQPRFNNNRNNGNYIEGQNTQQQVHIHNNNKNFNSQNQQHNQSQQQTAQQTPQEAPQLTIAQLEEMKLKQETLKRQYQELKKDPSQEKDFSLQSSIFAANASYDSKIQEIDGQIEALQLQISKLQEQSNAKQAQDGSQNRPKHFNSNYNNKRQFQSNNSSQGMGGYQPPTRGNPNHRPFNQGYQQGGQGNYGQRQQQPQQQRRNNPEIVNDDQNFPSLK